MLVRGDLRVWWARAALRSPSLDPLTSHHLCVGSVGARLQSAHTIDTYSLTRLQGSLVKLKKLKLDQLDTLNTFN